MLTIGDKIKLLRTEANISQKDAAKLLGTSAQMLSNYETNKNEPSISVVRRACEVFDVDFDLLLSDDEPYNNAETFLKSVTKLRELYDNREILTKHDSKQKIEDFLDMKVEPVLIPLPYKTGSIALKAPADFHPSVTFDEKDSFCYIVEQSDFYASRIFTKDVAYLFGYSLRDIESRTPPIDRIYLVKYKEDLLFKYVTLNDDDTLLLSSDYGQAQKVPRKEVKVFGYVFFTIKFAETALLIETAYFSNLDSKHFGKKIQQLKDEGRLPPDDD
ncbi:helix-turn-helix domain-containing protein [Listeria booriae]|uniref:helix-turn-helix domain-containing protein n=1 Tax=Listeria booriae TaxID=1552123 RepID=UPI00163D879E|nr:helix-turn-helix transcriptional regulator [Listeria booriae]MBC1306862.1 helix-turn-helix transcriptional regulator [Listeria booriae]